MRKEKSKSKKKGQIGQIVINYYIRRPLTLSFFSRALPFFVVAFQCLLVFMWWELVFMWCLVFAGCWWKTLVPLW
jgi:hypothetical protein